MPKVPKVMAFYLYFIQTQKTWFSGPIDDPAAGHRKGFGVEDHGDAGGEPALDVEAADDAIEFGVLLSAHQGPHDVAQPDSDDLQELVADHTLVGHDLGLAIEAGGDRPWGPTSAA